MQIDVRKYEEYFTITSYREYIDGKIDGKEVIDVMYNHFNLSNVDNIIEEIDTDIEYYLKGEKEIDNIDDYDEIDYIDMLITLYLQKSRLIDLKKAGFEHFFKIDFGDNDGDISGEGMGMIMDYEGRYLHISKDDIYLYTEQNR